MSEPTTTFLRPLSRPPSFASRSPSFASRSRPVRSEKRSRSAPVGGPLAAFLFGALIALVFVAATRSATP